MARWFRALAALAGDVSSVPAPLQATHHSSAADLKASSCLHGYPHTCAHTTHGPARIHIDKNKIFLKNLLLIWKGMKIFKGTYL